MAPSALGPDCSMAVHTTISCNIRPLNGAGRRTLGVNRLRVGNRIHRSRRTLVQIAHGWHSSTVPAAPLGYRATVPAQLALGLDGDRITSVRHVCTYGCCRDVNEPCAR